MSDTSNKSKHLENRAILQDFTTEAKAKAIANGLNPKNYTVNELLSRFIYNLPASRTLQTFLQWKEQGYKVVKGSKAFLLWARPKTREVENENGELESKSFFPVGYFFASTQVSAM